MSETNCDEIALEGGDTAPVVRVGETVRRRAGPWTPTIHALLVHLRNCGFQYCPEPLGFDDKGREVLTYIQGEAGRYPLPSWMWDEKVLVAVAKLLRLYHDATVGFLQPADARWQLASHGTAEVICHNDFAPYNLIFSNRRPVDVIDFDMASPGPRLWDFAYTAYRLIPLTSPDNPDTPSYDTRLAHDRLRLFARSYGLISSAQAVLEMAEQRLADWVLFIESRATAGDEAQQRVLARGDVALYESDRAYIKKHLS